MFPDTSNQLHSSADTGRGMCMAWFLQTPDEASPKLLAKIIDECGAASKGGAAFAFASAMGVKLLTTEPVFQKFLKSSEFVAVIGLDAITDTNAVEQLRKIQKKFPNFKVKLFLHDTAGSCFHPKTIWLKTTEGGVVITGSGNLTSGGLKANWEALTVEKLSVMQMKIAEAAWDAWLKTHKKQLLDLNDPKAIEKARTNRIQRAKIRKALRLPEEDNDAAEEAVHAAKEVVEEGTQNLVLIAEVPKSGDRWKQINFDVQTYQQFFGVTLGKPKAVRFHHVQNDGTLGAGENRQAVEVKSHNYRFEVGAAQGLDYPAKGHPIAIFEKVTDSTFNYLLLMPGQPEHALLQKYLDDTYLQTNSKRRIRITAGDLQKVWPASPLFL